MKKIFWILILLGNHVFAQTQIEGNLPSFANTSYSIVTDVSSLNDYLGKPIGKGRTDGSGKFNSSIDLNAEQPITIFIGNAFYNLWAKPNTRLSIQQSSNGSLSFSGASSSENYTLYNMRLMSPYSVPSNIGLDNFEPEKQLHYIDSIEAKRLSILNTAEQKGDLSKIFLSYCRTEILNFSFLNKNQYPLLLKATNKITDNDIPKDYFSFWNRFKIVEDSTASNSYQSALENYIEYKTLAKVGLSQIGKESYWQETFKIADSLLSDHPLTLQKQKTAYLSLLIKHFDLPELTSEEINNYLEQFPSSPSIATIESQWGIKHASTSVIPSFRLVDDNGNWVDIKELKGKVVYIDFWGSWCKACLLNLPYSEKLKEKFQGKDVVFLNLDFYDTHEKWINAIKKYKVNGINLKAETSDEDYFNKVFNINQGFPRYALIDKNGKIITISAPQPNEEGAFELIEKYLNE